MKYLVLGAGGMAGHLIATYLLESGEEVLGIARRNLDFCDTVVADVTEFEKIRRIILQNEFDCLVNCIGILNQNAENNIAQAVLINSYLPHFLADVTRETKTQVIHMSTDCVFSGIKGNYLETDNPDGTSVYSRTKALGELVDNKNLSFRNSIVGPDINMNGIGLFNWFMHENGTISGYSQSIWSGVTTLTLAKAIYRASKSNVTGLYHLTNNESISKYDLLNLFKERTNLDIAIKITEGIKHNKALINTRKDVLFDIPSYEVQINDMIEWIVGHKELYYLVYPMLFSRGGVIIINYSLLLEGIVA